VGLGHDAGPTAGHCVWGYDFTYNLPDMWTKMMGGARKKAPKTIAVIDPDRCFGAFACSICQAACPVANCIVEEPDRDGRMVCAVRADLCIGCGLCVTLGNPTAPQQREFGCPADYDAINMMPFEEVVKLLTAEPSEVPANS
jgi:Na+-translocating ferredoxin:NAD+ oxidoreductase subunit B